jgi:hypothetical protein
LPGGWIKKTVDLGVDPYDLSTPGGVQFQWTNGQWYKTRVIIIAFATPGTQAITEIAKYDDVSWITYTGSPGEHWVQSPSAPKIELNPPMGPVDTQVVVNGTGFVPAGMVYVYYDNQLVNRTVSDGAGNFMCLIKQPPDAGKGPHGVRAMDVIENQAEDFFDVFIEAGPVAPMDITGPTPGVPDGKIDIRDVAYVAKYFGKTDPNVDPPETTSAQDVSTSIPTIGLITITPVVLLARTRSIRKKQKITTD